MIALKEDEDGPLTVSLTEKLGGVSYTYAKTKTGERIVVEVRGAEALQAGTKVSMAFDPAQAYFFDAETEQRLR